jgi:predicted  nucleic acid-binding Zn-ribbon protein
MTTSSASLEPRVRKLETRQERTDEDMKAFVDTAVETREDVKALRADVTGLKQDVTGLKQDVTGLKQDVAGLTQRVEALQQDVGGLKQDVGWLKQGMTVLLARQGLIVEPDE